ncbi:hypothetical protein ACFO1V_04270 [Daeguia caeni]|uniref:Cellulose synthase regulatory subunit n=2 Tax=Daeguia caeni TaxID=439612 RepID=A0ABV9H201_9HYPH
MGLNWASVLSEKLCQDERQIGNALMISPETYLEYGYDPSSIRNIATVWSALPQKVTLLVASDKLDKASFDAAWRIGVALERAGKMVDVITLPSADSTVDVSGIDVPEALRQIPAFAAIAKGGKVTLKNEAEAGALLLLNAPALRAHIAVADASLSSRVQAALNAVRSELVETDPEAASIIDALAERSNALAKAPDSKMVEARSIAGRPVIAIAPDAAAEAAGLFSELWRRTAVARKLILNEVSKPEENSDIVPLASLNQAANSLDVVARGDWTTTFDLGTSIEQGKIPDYLEVVVSAAPGATRTRPVASVFINDYLLGAKQLKADGRPETISVAVPTYALQPRNTVRVEFQRQPSSDECRETPQAYPVAVLPSSHMRLKPAGAAEDFPTLVPHLAGSSSVMIPAEWQNNAIKNLPTVISIANAAGIMPSDAELVVVENSATVTPTKPFLAFDVAIKSAKETVKVEGDHVSISDKKGKVFYDVKGQNEIAVVQVVNDNNQPGLVYNNVGAGPAFEDLLYLANGDVAVLGDKGVLASVNSAGVPLYLNANDTQGGDEKGFSLRKLTDPSYWMHNFSWLLTLGLFGLFLILLVLAQIVRKRKGNH